MKKLLLLIVIVLLSSTAIAQDRLYVVLEFMKVHEKQETLYNETETFWEKIHAQRVKDKDIIGWNLWTLRPGGEDQGYQYLTMTFYDNPVKMFNNSDMMAFAKKAFPGKSEEELQQSFDNTPKSRELAVRNYLERIDKTNDDYDMPIGTIANIDMMKVSLGNYAEYEKAESEIFKPSHQREIDEDLRASWSLLRFISPVGSDTYASHITINVYKNFEQVFRLSNEDVDTPVLSEEEQKVINDGLALRQQKYIHMASLLKKVGQ